MTSKPYDFTGYLRLPESSPVEGGLTAEERKQRPLYSGVIKYFPDALMEVAHTSWVGNEQHNPGSELHWDRTKSQDEPDALLRHVTDRARGEKFDTDGARHLAKAAWRVLAWLQKEIESERGCQECSNDA